MRAPRSKQRFPGGGQVLWELCRMDHEPVFVAVFPSTEITKARAALPDTLTYEPAFDPMLYFWPVEGQHVVVFLKEPQHEDTIRRLGKAMLRDGADWVTVTWSVDRTAEERHEFARDWLRRPEIRSFGDPQVHFAKRHPELLDAAVAGPG